MYWLIWLLDQHKLLSTWMQSFHLISGLLEHNQSFDDIWSCSTVAWLTSSNTPSDWTLCYWSMFIRVFGGSGQVTALHCSLPRVPHYWAPCRCQPTQCPPFLLPWLRQQHRPPGRATAGSAELAETESKLFNDNDDLDKHNKNDSSALEDS